MFAAMDRAPRVQASLLAVGLVLLVGLASTLLAGCTAPREDFQRRQLIVGCSFDSPSLSTLGPDGRPQGRDVELLRRIARRFDRVLVWSRIPADGLLEAGESLRVQVVCASLSGLDAERVDLTRAHRWESLVIVVLADERAPASRSDLAGKRVGVDGPAAEVVRRELPAAKPVAVRGPAAGGALLARGELDALVLPAAAARDLRDIGAGTLRVLSEPLASRPISLGVAPGEERGALLEALDRALEEMQRSGELAALDESYGLGTDL